MSPCNLKNPPVFFIGMPRSGTTIVFEKFVDNESSGWLSNYSEMFPKMPSMNLLCRLLDNEFFSLRGRKKQYGSVRLGNRYLPQPVEAYSFWNLYSRPDFSRDYLLQAHADSEEIQRVRCAVKRTLYYQGKEQFVTKLTGPGRITYLASIFPDARFIHVIRDGRSVINSLMNVDFWRGKGGYDHPYWNNGLTPDALEPWHKVKHPAVLAAIQWINVIKTIRHEANMLMSRQYSEIHYEEFVMNPHSETDRLYEFADIEPCRISSNTLSLNTISDMNKRKLIGVSDKVSSTVNSLLHETLKDVGYVP